MASREKGAFAAAGAAGNDFVTLAESYPGRHRSSGISSQGYVNPSCYSNPLYSESSCVGLFGGSTGSVIIVLVYFAKRVETSEFDLSCWYIPLTASIFSCINE